MIRADKSIMGRSSSGSFASLRSGPPPVVEAGWTIGAAVRDLNEYKVGALLSSGVSADDEEQFFDPGAGWGRCAPLYLAVIWGYDRLVTELLEFDADTEWPHPKYGSTALHLAAQHGMEGVLTQLLEKDANPNATDCDGCTPLITASLYGHTVCVDLLLKSKGCNSRIRSPGLGTALKCAEREGFKAGELVPPFKEIARLLGRAERRQKVDLPSNASDAEVESAERVAEGQAAAARDEWGKAVWCYEQALKLTPEGELLPSQRKIEPLLNYSKTHFLKQRYLGTLTSITAVKYRSALDDGREALGLFSWDVEKALDFLINPPDPEPELPPEPEPTPKKKKKLLKLGDTKKTGKKGARKKKKKVAVEVLEDAPAAPTPFAPFKLPELGTPLPPRPPSADAVKPQAEAEAEPEPEPELESEPEPEPEPEPEMETKTEPKPEPEVQAEKEAAPAEAAPEPETEAATEEFEPLAEADVDVAGEAAPELEPEPQVLAEADANAAKLEHAPEPLSEPAAAAPAAVKEEAAVESPTAEEAAAEQPSARVIASHPV